MSPILTPVTLRRFGPFMGVVYGCMLWFITNKYAHVSVNVRMRVRLREREREKEKQKGKQKWPENK